MDEHHQYVKVRVYPPPFSDPQAIDEDGYVTLPAGAKLADLLRELNIPLVRAAALLCKVNYQKAGASRVLEDGDTISFLTAFSGG